MDSETHLRTSIAGHVAEVPQVITGSGITDPDTASIELIRDSGYLPTSPECRRKRQLTVGFGDLCKSVAEGGEAESEPKDLLVLGKDRGHGRRR